MPVRFCINGAELLELHASGNRDVFIVPPHGEAQRVQLPYEERAWLRLPLLGFATDMLQALQEMGMHGTQKVSLAGSGTLHLAREGDQLFLTSDNGKTVTTDVAEVIDAFRDFLGKVRSMLLSHVPEIENHPFWDQWFSQG